MWEPFEIEFTEELEAWWDSLSVDQQEAVTDRVVLLGERPGSRAAGGGADPPFAASQHEGTAGEQGWRVAGVVHVRELNDWYETAIPLADDLYDRYLEELRKEGLI